LTEARGEPANSSEFRAHETSIWRIRLPVTVTGGPVSKLTNPELTTMAIFRGWVGESPMSVTISSRPRAGRTLRAECRRLETNFQSPRNGDFEFSVPGARGARRVDGLMNLEEGLGEPPDWTEQVTYIVAARGKNEFVILTLRRRPAQLAEPTEAIIRSFALIFASRPEP
jgi:hypothetical protein